MVQTRSQLENLSKAELIDEVLSFDSFKNDINSKFSKVSDRFNNVQAMFKYGMVNSNLLISGCCNELVLEPICIKGQYNRRETLEFNPAPSHIAHDVLEQSVPSAITYRNISRTRQYASL